MNLTINQNKAISEIENNLQIIACSGSGKTEVITRRIAHILNTKQNIDSSDIVAFTFTEKAAISLKNRINRAIEAEHSKNQNLCNDMYVGTIHGFCKYILNNFTEKFSHISVLDNAKNFLFIQRYANKLGFEALGLKKDYYSIRLFLDAISKMVDDYDNWDKRDREIFEKYREFLYSKQYIDFSNLILEAILQIESNTALREYISSVKYLIVDEYQDVNDLQEKIIRMFYELNTNICVVGDDDQTIYQFRGSNANNIINFYNNYKNTTSVVLDENFRSVSEIVELASMVIRNNKNRLEKNMFSNIDSNSGGAVVKKIFDSKDEEYSFIINEIKRLNQNGVPYNKIAVLMRKNKHLEDFSKSLEKNNLKYTSVGLKYFFEEDKSYFSVFKEIIQNLLDIDKASLYAVFETYTERHTFNNAFRFLRKASRGDGDSNLKNIVKEFLEIINFFDESTEDFKYRKEDFEAFTKILEDFDEIYEDTQLSYKIREFDYFLNRNARKMYEYENVKVSENIDEDAINIMTVHKSKGLEFEVVFVPNLLDGEFPMNNIGGRKYWQILGKHFEENKDKYISTLEDERKLFYVAITRAKEKLYILSYKDKKAISQFLVESGIELKMDYLN